MRRFLLFIVFGIFFSSAGNSQQHYNLVYGHGIIDTTDNSLKAKYNSLLVILRNTSYECTIPWKGKLKEPLGKEFSSHSIYTDYNQGVRISQSQPYGHPKYLILDTIRKIDWHHEEGMKLIAGYNCNAATATVDGREVL